MSYAKEFRNWHRDRQYYICARLRMVEFLRRKGYLPIKTLPDAKNPKYNVWVYENSEELADAIEEFLIQQENRLK